MEVHTQKEIWKDILPAAGSGHPQGRDWTRDGDWQERSFLLYRSVLVQSFTSVCFAINNVNGIKEYEKKRFKD